MQPDDSFDFGAFARGLTGGDRAAQVGAELKRVGAITVRDAGKRFNQQKYLQSLEKLGRALKGEDVSSLYEWFLPLLRLDVVVKFVQLIKLAQEKVGMGSARVRPPRLELVGPEREQTEIIIKKALAKRPRL